MTKRYQFRRAVRYVALIVVVCGSALLIGWATTRWSIEQVRERAMEEVPDDFNAVVASWLRQQAEERTDPIEHGMMIDAAEHNQRVEQQINQMRVQTPP